jgi:hypothetical protein
MSALSRWAGRVRALASNGSARWAFFTLLAAAAAWPYLRTAGGFNDFRDANVLWLYEDAARRSVLDFGQLPLWNPDFCGGLPALGTPQSRFASPTFFFTLLFGTTRAEPVTVYAMVLLALEGARRYARLRRASQLGATVAAPVFGLMGIFACAPFLGWFGFLGFALLPWLLVGTRQAARGSLLGVALVAGCTATMVGFGGTYVAPISLVACAVEVAMLAVAPRGRLSWAGLAVAGNAAAGLSAFRLWPVWEELQRAPRLVAGISAVNLQSLGGHLFGAWPIMTSEHWYFVGVPAALVAALALLRKRSRSLVVAFAFWLWLAAGSAATPSLYALLRQLPLFSLLRNSERFLVPAALVIATGVAFAVSDLEARLRRGGGSRLVRHLTLVGAGAVALALWLNVPWQLNNFSLAAARRTLVDEPQPLQRPFHQARGNRWLASSFGPMSRGSLACWEAYAVPQSPKLKADATQESWLGEADAGTVAERAWSPQRLDYLATLVRPTRLVVNQNYHRGWKSSVGSVVNEEGLLAVELPAGRHEVTLRFAPTSAVGGLMVSALTALMLVGLLWRRERRLGRGALLLLVPLGAGVAIALTSTEAPQLPSMPSGPEGEPLISTELPKGATPLGVRFAADVVLEGALLTYRPEDDRVRIELDWSHGPSVGRQLGFFVHLEPGTQKRLGADHLQLSDAVFLEATPPGRILRDIVLIDVPQSKRADPWNVWVGLWEMRGDGSRVAVTDARGVSTQDGRVLAGTVRIGPEPDGGAQ